MNFLRKTLTLRVFSLVMTLAIFNLSCTKENTLVESQLRSKAPCNGMVDFSGIDNVPNAFENMMYMVETIQRNDAFDTFGGLYQYFYGDSEQAVQNIQIFEKESQTYVNLGFDGYMSDVVRRGIMSEAMKSELLRFKSELTTFVNTRHPRLEQFIGFLDTYGQGIEGTRRLCPEEIIAMESILASVQGYAQYFYKKYYTEANLSLRGCNFWEGLLCGTLAVIVGVTIFNIFQILSLYSITVTYFDQDGNVHQGTEQQSADFVVFLGVVAGIWAGVDMYKWCCSWFDEAEEAQRCEAPTGHFYKILDCSEYEYRIFGPSEYGTTQWWNTNTAPEETVTPTPVLRFTIPSSEDASNLFAVVSCLSPDLHLYDYNQTINFAGAEDPFDLKWVQRPPSTLTLDQIVTIDGEILTLNGHIQASVNVPYNGQYEYHWSINAPYVISGSTTSSSATLVLLQPGTAVTTVTVTNVCTGDTQTISATTIVQN